MKVLFLNGPNLNLLGQREPEIYGSMTLSDIEDMVCQHAEKHKVEVVFYQSNHEGELVTQIHQAIGNYDAIPGVGINAIEIHLTNVHARESYRRKSIIGQACVGNISGFGASSYILGLEAAILHDKANS